MYLLVCAHGCYVSSWHSVNKLIHSGHTYLHATGRNKKPLRVTNIKTGFEFVSATLTIEGRSQHLSRLVQPRLQIISNIWSWNCAPENEIACFTFLIHDLHLKTQNKEKKKKNNATTNKKRSDEDTWQTLHFAAGKSIWGRGGVVDRGVGGLVA